MISDTIYEKIKEAMKSGDEVKLSTLKLLSSAFHNAEIDKKREKLTEEEELEIVRFEAKKRKDAIEVYKKANAKDRVKREEEELAILQEYLPKDLSKEEIDNLVDESIKQTGATSMADMGKVMGIVMGKTKGRADGNQVMEVVKAKLG